MTVQGLMLYALLGFFFSAYFCSKVKANKYLVFAVWPWYAFLFVMSQITRNF
jgi:hypothetical protein